MPVPRLALLLALLASTAFAAPAPLPRKKEAPHAGAWSEPVDGLRVRLVAPARKCRAGEPILVTLEVQNAGPTRLALEGPCLMPAVTAPGDHLHRGRHFPWAITSESAQKPRGRGEREKQIDQMDAWCLLPPGGTLRVRVAITPRAREVVEEAKRGARKGEDRREDLAFDGEIRPGVYELRASFSRAAKGGKARKGEWGGVELKSPPLSTAFRKSSGSFTWP